MRRLLSLALLAACTGKGTPADTAPTGDDTGDGTVYEADWPAWAWEHWVWEDESTQDSLMEMVDGYRDHDIPVSAVIIDSPWATGYNTFQWDTDRFPDPQGMIDELHSRDIKVMLWIVPAINVDTQPLYDEWAANDWFMKREAGGAPGVVEWWKGDGSLVDYWNPEAVEAWHALMAPVLAQGIDGWKTDGLGFGAIVSPWSEGLGRDVERVEYSHAYYQDFHDHTRAVNGADTLITARPVDNYGADIGGEAVSFAPLELGYAGWVGDQDADFSGIRAVLRNFYWSADMGYLAFGSDIGGYRDSGEVENGRTKEVFLSWTWLGVFSPVMENGGGGNHWPWLWDTETTDIYRDAVDLHLAMLPVLRQQGARAKAEGRSLMTFLDKDSKTYLLGDDVLVVPVQDESATVTVAFPEGEDWAWIFGDHAVHAGGTEATLTVGLDEYPAFVRVGSPMESALSAR